MVCIPCNIIGTSNNQHSIGFDTSLGKKTLQASILEVGSPNFDANLDVIKLWVEPKSINIEVDWLPMNSWTCNIEGSLVIRFSETVVDTQIISLFFDTTGVSTSTANAADCFGYFPVGRKQSLAKCPGSWQL